MLIRYTVLSVILVCLVGCTSFKTSALLRLENDSVVREPTNQKLKGIPVKMKVPSHVGVTIYEQQILMAPDAGFVDSLKAAEKEAKGKITPIANTIKSLETELDKHKKTIEGQIALKEHYVELLNRINNDVGHASFSKWDGEVIKLDQVIAETNADIDAVTKNIDQANKNLIDAQEVATEATKAASTPQYSLVSFTPAQLTVDTELIYTDKVFLVDFKRPAGGILNLTEAKMDDEQYFANVAAEVTERTIQDINTGLKTLTAKESENNAVPTSANTPEAKVADGINFQKSVIAYKRFDISEPGWEHQMDEFVKRYVGQSLQIEVCPSQQPLCPQPGTPKAQVDDLVPPPALSSGADLAPPFSPAVE
ncbi:hypothetical protein V6x_52450 [Gimesia chilikensis]|uniref:Uncharacterized protein n=1 Tax=Gimesia chilikensis TaxID=2605989 RepID=A0A517WJT2_9PLAN|nr:hypothetical protein [Gimesia chilikensis]QDU05508.1 hypothetical protein V6x_52450 [Gimesia chilikensis]